MANKLPVHRDEPMERLAGVQLESCAAYFDGEAGVRIVGEAIAAGGRAIGDYREIQAIVYDEEGDILGRDITNWSEFQLRQSFEIEVQDLPGMPYRVKVFPSKG